jgi:hypothetical protein
VVEAVIVLALVHCAWMKPLLRSTRPENGGSNLMFGGNRSHYSLYEFNAEDAQAVFGIGEVLTKVLAELYEGAGLIEVVTSMFAEKSGNTKFASFDACPLPWDAGDASMASMRKFPKFMSSDVVWLGFFCINLAICSVLAFGYGAALFSLFSGSLTISVNPVTKLCSTLAAAGVLLFVPVGFVVGVHCWVRYKVGKRTSSTFPPFLIPYLSEIDDDAYVFSGIATRR